MYDHMRLLHGPFGYLFIDNKILYYFISFSFCSHVRCHSHAVLW